MSEFEKQDQEVMAMANKDEKKSFIREGGVREDRRAKEQRHRYIARQRLKIILQVLLCVLIAVAFLVAMVNPCAVVIVTNFGVLCCGCVIAVSVDRFIRRR